jgi:hypothetical protein
VAFNCIASISYYPIDVAGDLFRGSGHNYSHYLTNQLVAEFGRRDSHQIAPMMTADTTEAPIQKMLAGAKS